MLRTTLRWTIAALAVIGTVVSGSLALFLFALGISSSEEHDIRSGALIFGAILMFISLGLGIGARKLMPKRGHVAAAYVDYEQIKGTTFPRSKFTFALVLFSVLPTLILLAGGLGTCLGVVATIATGAWASWRFVMLVLACVFLLSFSSMMLWNVWFHIRAWGTPLAIINSEGIALPHTKPGYLCWTDIKSVSVRRIGKAAILDFELLEPERHLDMRARWWHFIYRKSVTLNVGDTWNPIVQAARQAHERATGQGASA